MLASDISVDKFWPGSVKSDLSSAQQVWLLTGFLQNGQDWKNQNKRWVKWNREMLQTLPLKCNFKSDYWNQRDFLHPKVTSGTYNSVSISKKSIYNVHFMEIAKILTVCTLVLHTICNLSIATCKLWVWQTNQDINFLSFSLDWFQFCQ